jgi:hypothetical protein
MRVGGGEGIGVVMWKSCVVGASAVLIVSGTVCKYGCLIRAMGQCVGIHWCVGVGTGWCVVRAGGDDCPKECIYLCHLQHSPTNVSSLICSVAELQR